MSFPIIPKTLKQYLKNPFFVIKKRKEKRKTKEKRRENSILSHSYLSNFLFSKANLPNWPTKPSSISVLGSSSRSSQGTPCYCKPQAGPPTRPQEFYQNHTSASPFLRGSCTVPLSPHISSTEPWRREALNAHSLRNASLP